MIYRPSRFYFIFLFAGFLCLIYSCTGLKKIPKGSSLYTGAELVYVSDFSYKKEKEIKRSDDGLIRPDPNGKLLWMRPGLSLYNSIKKPKKERGLGHWLKNKIGKPPVLFDADIPKNTAERISNHLFHRGFFEARVDYEIKQTKKTTGIRYYVYPGHAHLIDTLIMPADSTSIGIALRRQRESSLINEGDRYDLDQLKIERGRLSDEVQNLGYYHFNPDYLYYRADTTNSKYKVDLTLKVKPNIPPQAQSQYRISSVYITDDFQLQSDEKRDTTRIGNYYYISKSHGIRPEIVLDEVFLSENRLYNGAIHHRTINYLMALGNFKYANIQYINENDSSNTLDANILLSPYKKYSLSAEVNTVTKTNNFFGPGIRLSFLNRNILGGSEILTTNVNAGYEWQVTNNDFGTTSLELSSETSLIIPRIVPFKQNKATKKYLGSSRITGGVGYYNRVDLYKFFTLSGSYKYTWIKRPKIIHELLPFDVSINNLLKTSPEFNAYLNENPSVRRSLEDQFILGATYNFTYNALREKHFVYSGGIEFAGNTLSMFGRLTGRPPDKNDPKSFLGVPYSQFVRLKNEFRYQLLASKNDVIATRVIASIGLPYSNSSVLPYVRQFFSGGSNSIRAFRARSIGPGSYYPSDTSSFFLVDQSGDIRFEANVEYRFPIVRYLKGALFIDAGNIWLINDDPDRPGGVFTADKFLKDLAVGVGYGLRVDMDIIVLRFDWAFPLRKPYLEEDNRWNDIDFFNSQWRRENIILNISIGYPF